MSAPVSSKTFSLQKRLISNVLISNVISGVLGLLLVTSITAYDMHEFFDDILEENGKLVMQGAQQHNARLNAHLEEFNEELDLVYQIVDNKQNTLSLSEDAPSKLLVTEAQSDEFYTVRQHQVWWRVYVLNSPDGKQIQVAQRWQQRYSHFLPAIAHFVWVMFIVWLLVIIGSWFSIRQSLKSVKHMTALITEKQVQDLSPIQPTEMMLEMQPMLHSINQLLTRLDTALKAEQQFTADAAHELRTPLAAIQMKLQLLQRRYAGYLQPLQQEMQQLENDVKRSTAVVENLLLLARLDPEQNHHLAKTSTNVAQLLDELLSSVHLQAEQAQVCITSDIQLAQDFGFDMNKALMFTALRNVLDNAIRYSGAQSTVLFTARTEQMHLLLEIRDNGAGVSQQDQQRLSDRFFRVLGTGQPGSGLGLSIVKQIVGLHQGQLHFIAGLHGRGFGVRIQL